MLIGFYTREFNATFVKRRCSVVRWNAILLRVEAASMRSSRHREYSIVKQSAIPLDTKKGCHLTTSFLNSLKLMQDSRDQGLGIQGKNFPPLTKLLYSDNCEIVVQAQKQWYVHQHLADCRIL